MLSKQILAGVYQHFKGGTYEVFGVAQLVDADVVFVIYRPCYGNRDLVARPLEQFLQSVNIDGVERPRFKFIRSLETESRLTSSPCFNSLLHSTSSDIL